jgi:hypothetical protein
VQAGGQAGGHSGQKREAWGKTNSRWNRFKRFGPCELIGGARGLLLGLDRAMMVRGVMMFWVGLGWVGSAAEGLGEA